MIESMEEAWCKPRFADRVEGILIALSQPAPTAKEAYGAVVHAVRERVTEAGITSGIEGVCSCCTGFGTGSSTSITRTATPRGGPSSARTSTRRASACFS